MAKFALLLSVVYVFLQYFWTNIKIKVPILGQKNAADRDTKSITCNCLNFDASLPGQIWIWTTILLKNLMTILQFTYPISLKLHNKGYFAIVRGFSESQVSNWIGLDFNSKKASKSLRFH
jgi:hypothetical protein